MTDAALYVMVMTEISRIGEARIPRHYLISILYFISVRYHIRVLYLIYGIGLVIIDVIHESNGVW